MYKTRRKKTLAAAATIFFVFSWTTCTSNLYLTLLGLGKLENVDKPRPESILLASEFNAPTLYSSGACAQHENIQNRLKIADANWIRSQSRRSQVLHEIKLNNGLDSSNARILWDFFYPSFDCPFTKERIGRVGDGGKWICGFDQLVTKVNCVIFSFGISSDTSFEEEVLRRTQSCTVHMFDPTIAAEPALVSQYPGRAYFHCQGIGYADEGQLATLKSIMTSLGVEKIDVLKMDVEGAEWDAVRKILKDFPDDLPFAQAQIELHLNTFGAEDWFQALNKWWDQVELAGLRQFFNEPNLLGEERYMYREVAFLNIKMEPFKLL